ncbi:MAG TPA: hypothetical protein VGA50_06080 [Kiloniellales bacterium]
MFGMMSLASGWIFESRSALSHDFDWCAVMGFAAPSRSARFRPTLGKRPSARYSCALAID